jgi:hypothetical protein
MRLFFLHTSTHLYINLAKIGIILMKHGIYKEMSEIALDEKLRTYFNIMKVRYELIYSRKILAEEIRNRMIKGETDLLFLKYVRGTFVRDMVLSTAHMYERNIKNNENVNLHRLLKLFQKHLCENPKKNEKIIKNAINSLIKPKIFGRVN